MLLELLILVVVILALAKLIEPAVSRALERLRKAEPDRTLEQTLRKSPGVPARPMTAGLPPLDPSAIDGKGRTPTTRRSDGPVEAYLKGRSGSDSPDKPKWDDGIQRKEGME